jgi:hypothetical protein
LALIISLSTMSGCVGGDDDNTNTGSNNAPVASNGASPNQTTPGASQPGTTATPAAGKTSATGASGILRADPNPIQVCDGTGAGKTTIFWDAKGVQQIQVRVGSPTGDMMVDSPLAQGRADTGKWVGGGMKFYLQDVSGGRSTTLATLTVNVTNVGCR